MEKSVFHPANERGHVNHGWLNAAHHFLVLHHGNTPKGTAFGALRVLNDDIVH